LSGRDTINPLFGEPFLIRSIDMWHLKANNHNSAPDQAATSVIDQGCEFEGRLTFVGTLVLNGKLEGEVLSPDTLVVGENGELRANVQVGIAIISGQMTGNIVARERVELRPTARIFGDIVTPVLILEEGVIFDGRCKMRGEEVQAAEKIH